jgi:hypothetical protein
LAIRFRSPSICGCTNVTANSGERTGSSGYRPQSCFHSWVRSASSPPKTPEDGGASVRHVSRLTEPADHLYADSRDVRRSAAGCRRRCGHRPTCPPRPKRIIGPGSALAHQATTRIFRSIGPFAVTTFTCKMHCGGASDLRWTGRPAAISASPSISDCTPAIRSAAARAPSPCSRPARYALLDRLRRDKRDHSHQRGVETRVGSALSLGPRSPDWLKMKNPAFAAVKREAEEDWGRRLVASARSPAFQTSDGKSHDRHIERDHFSCAGTPVRLGSFPHRASFVSNR